MRSVMLWMGVLICCARAGAQVPSTGPAAGLPAAGAAAPVQPAPGGVKEDVSRVAPAPDAAELKKKHGEAVAALKRRHKAELDKLRKSGGPRAKAALPKAVRVRKTEQKTELDALKKANQQEMERFRKDRAPEGKKPEKDTKTDGEEQPSKEGDIPGPAIGQP